MARKDSSRLKCRAGSLAVGSQFRLCGQHSPKSETLERVLLLLRAAGPLSPTTAEGRRLGMLPHREASRVSKLRRNPPGVQADAAAPDAFLEALGVG